MTLPDIPRDLSKGCCTERITMIVFSDSIVVDLLEAPGNHIHVACGREKQ